MKNCVFGNMTTTVIKYVGRTTNFSGNTLWEIVGRLKNFGVGRIVVRSINDKYPEPSFMKIVKVETCPEDVENIRKVRVWVEKTFRGVKLPKLTEIHRTSYKADYKLIPKNEEAQFSDIKNIYSFPDVILPRTIEMPPLMKAFIQADQRKKGLQPAKEYIMRLSYNSSPNKVKRIAKEGEEPTIKFTMSLGKPASPSLYEGIN